MGNTVTKGVNVIELSAIDSDWNYATAFPSQVRGIRVDQIIFSGGDTDGDKLSMRDGTETGAHIFPTQAILKQGGPTIVQYGGKELRPYIKFSECTLSTGHSIIIIMQS